MAEDLNWPQTHHINNPDPAQAKVMNIFIFQF